MRLGDLDALKDKLTDTINPNDIAKNEWYEGYAACVQVLSDLIDNAPTVEPCYQTTSCLDCKNYDKETHNCPRYCEVIKEAIKSRPRGEWVEKEETPASVSYYCSVCKIEGIPITPFCPWCGAKMKGGAE